VVLRRQMNEAAGLGYTYNTGPELEFFLLKTGEGKVEPVPHDAGGYFDLTEDLGADVRREMVRALEAMGIEVETSHHEVAVGQHEIDFKYADAVTTADNAVTLRYTLKAVAQRHGLHATFMPKPIEGVNGSGMHVHQSLSRRDGGANAFIGNGDKSANPYGLSTLARHFIAGQLAHARGMCAVLAPTVNSYKRLVPGFEAPVYLSWARTNRSALVRIPRISPSQPAATRIELRCPDPAANPYLAFAVMLAAGLDGIRRELQPPDPMEENLYHLTNEDLAERGVRTLPVNLGEALQELERDEVICAALGEHVLSHFREAKVQEWNSYRRHVSSWEIERYLEVL
jgi:glutamine synthetase